MVMQCIRLIVTGSAVAAADTISAPWTPASSGPPPDANGSGSDTKNLDVGEISDVSFYFNEVNFHPPVRVDLIE